MSILKDQMSGQSLGILTQALALAVSAGFAVSVIYDWGYLKTLGLGFSEVPTSISDHIRTGLLWAPPIFAMAIFLFGAEFQIRRIERGLTEEEIVASSKNPRLLRMFRNSPYTFLFLLSVFGLSSYLAVGDVVAPLMPMAAIITWMAFASWCYKSPLIQLRRNWLVQMAFFFIPAVFFFSFFTGKNDARALLDNLKRPIEITMASSGIKEKANHLRNFEKGMLILTPAGTVKFVQWSSIIEYEFAEPPEEFKGVICEVFMKCPEALHE